MTELTGLTAEQRDHLDKHIAGIGHNQGPALVGHADEILAKVSHHSHLRKEAVRIRIMLDMLRSHVSGEHLLPIVTVGYVFAGVALLAAITGVGIAATPIATLLLDAPVVAIIIATLGGEIDGYVDWRAARDPSYESVKQELYGDSGTR